MKNRILFFFASIAMTFMATADKAMAITFSDYSRTPCHLEEYVGVRDALQNPNVRLQEKPPGAARDLLELFNQDPGPLCVNFTSFDIVMTIPQEEVHQYEFTDMRDLFVVTIAFSKIDGRVVRVEVTQLP